MHHDVSGINMEKKEFASLQIEKLVITELLLYCPDKLIKFFSYDIM